MNEALIIRILNLPFSPDLYAYGLQSIAKSKEFIERKCFESNEEVNEALDDVDEHTFQNYTPLWMESIFGEKLVKCIEFN